MLEEAGDCARVTEVSEAGSVPFLKVANGADRPLDVDSPAGAIRDLYSRHETDMAVARQALAGEGS